MASIQWSQEQLKAAFFSSTFLPYLICFLLLLIIIIMLNLAIAKIKPNLTLPPSPPKLPIIGNLHQLGTLPHHSFRALSRKHGALMMLQFGWSQSLVVSSADVAREIMKSHDIAFSDRPQSTATKILLYGCDDIGFAPYGECWRKKRKICVLELLSPKRVQSLRHIREEEVKELVNKIRETSSGDVNLSELLAETTNNIICKCVLGQRFNKKTCYNKVKELARKLMSQITVATIGDLFPLLGWVDVLTGQIQEFKSTFAAFDALFDEVIAEHKRNMKKRERGECSSEKDFVDILIQLQEDGMPDFEVTNDDIKALLMDMFAAGSGTTTITLEWAITELVKNPKTLKKAQEEVRRFVEHKSKIEENDINQMDYIKCVVKETLRLHPPAPFLFPRVTSSNVKLRGYDIPANTTVYVNAWAIQMDPEFWEMPEEFIPERHINNQVSFKGQDSQFIPFGFGRRGCPGMTFGLVSIEYALVNLLCWFDWKLPLQDIDMGETGGFLVAKKVPLHLKPIPFSFESKC